MRVNICPFCDEIWVTDFYQFNGDPENHKPSRLYQIQFQTGNYGCSLRNCHDCISIYFKNMKTNLHWTKYRNSEWKESELKNE